MLFGDEEGQDQRVRRGAGAVLSVGLSVRGLQLGSRCLPHGLAHEQPGLTLIPEVAHGNKMRQRPIPEGVVLRSFLPIKGQCLSLINLSHLEVEDGHRVHFHVIETDFGIGAAVSLAGVDADLVAVGITSE